MGDRIRKTSLEVYNRIKEDGTLSKRRWEIYEIVFKHGPMTSNETFEHSELKSLDGYRHNANARMTELRDMGVVEEVGTRLCTVTGERVILWDVTDRLPKKLQKRESKVKVYEKALREIFETTTDLISRSIAEDALKGAMRNETTN